MSAIADQQTYREYLATIKDPDDLTGICVNAVLTATVWADDGEGFREVTGTIVAIEHGTGFGLFGPMLRTRVKLCVSCVHQQGRDCTAPDDLPWLEASEVITLRRNGDLLVSEPTP